MVGQSFINAHTIASHSRNCIQDCGHLSGHALYTEKVLLDPLNGCGRNLLAKASQFNRRHGQHLGILIVRHGPQNRAISGMKTIRVPSHRDNLEAYAAIRMPGKLFDSVHDLGTPRVGSYSVERSQQNPQIRIAQKLYQSRHRQRHSQVNMILQHVLPHDGIRIKKCFLSNLQKIGPNGGRDGPKDLATVDFNHLDATASQPADQTGNHGRDFTPYLDVGVA